MKLDKHLNRLESFKNSLYFRMTACISYYALTLNSTQLSGDIVLNFTLNGVIELPIPFIMLFTLNHLGRRPMIFIGHILLGCSCLALAFVPKAKLNF